MDTTNINVRVDSALKQEAETLFNDLGLFLFRTGTHSDLF